MKNFISQAVGVRYCLGLSDLAAKPTVLVRCLDLLLFIMYSLIKIGLRKWNFFGVKEFFVVYYDFKNGCKNEFQDNNEKSCNWFKNKVRKKSILEPMGLTSPTRQPGS